MSDDNIGKAELLTLALAHTDAGAFLGGKIDWPALRDYDCPTCGPRTGSDVYQVDRDEVCLYACRQCHETVGETTPF